MPCKAAARVMMPMPIDTQLPWPSSKCSQASTACPALWPKLSSFRWLVSRSSATTTARLMSILRAMMSATRATSRLSSSSVSGVFSSSSNSSGSAITACLTTSPQPSANCSGVRVARHPTSAITTLGCQKAPARFLPAARSIAVLPPTEESTMASRLVGICTNLQPRM